MSDDLLREAYELICKYLYPDLIIKEFTVDDLGQVHITFRAKTNVYCYVPYPTVPLWVVDKLDRAVQRVWKANGVSAETRRSTPAYLNPPPVPSSMLHAENQPGTPGPTTSGTVKNADAPSAPL